MAISDSLRGSGMGERLGTETAQRIRCEGCGTTSDTPAYKTCVQVPIAGRHELAAAIEEMAEPEKMGQP